MRITSVHERTIAAPADRIGELLNTIASDNDMFWPHENWSAIRFDRPLQVGATGGHGTRPYTVTSYTPGRHIRFDLAGGVRSGFHEFEVRPLAGGGSLLRHSLDVRLPLGGVYLWYAKIRRCTMRCWKTWWTRSKDSSAALCGRGCGVHVSKDCARNAECRR